MGLGKAEGLARGHTAGAGVGVRTMPMPSSHFMPFTDCLPTSFPALSTQQVFRSRLVNMYTHVGVLSYALGAGPSSPSAHLR